MLYFERIVEGRHLEAFVPTTPKPLLTAVFGPLHAATHDWRPLAWATLLIDCLGVVMMAALANRIAGAIAGAFVGLLLMLNTSLLFDVGFALAVPWALVGWAAAGLAYSARQPRYALAGLALAWATLARVETLVLIGVILVALAWGSFAPQRWRLATPPARTWLVPLLGLLAIPVMCGHDLLLTGDPLYWLTVAPRYSAQDATKLPTAWEVATALVEHLWLAGGVVILAIIGFADVVRARRHWLAVALVGLGPAMAAFLLYLAIRGLIVPVRYAAPIDVAVIFAGGIGAVVVARVAAGVLRPNSLGGRLSERAMALIGIGVVVACAIVLAGPGWAIGDLRTTVTSSLRLAIDADAAKPSIAAALVDAPAVPQGQARVLVPGRIGPRLAVDLGLTLGELSGSIARDIDVAAGYPARGTIVFHDRSADAAAAGWEDFEIEEPQQVGSVLLDPIVADPRRGYWVVAVR